MSFSCAPVEHKAVPAAVQAALGAHHSVPEGLGDQQAQLHAPTLHQPPAGHGAPRQPLSGPQLQERCAQSGTHTIWKGTKLMYSSTGLGYTFKCYL